MDLSSLKPDTVKVNITHPDTGEDIGLEVELASVFSDETQKAYMEMRKSGLASKIADDEQRPKHLDAEAFAEVLSIAASVKDWSWSNDLDWQGDANPECNIDNVQEVLAHEGLAFIRLQLKRRIEDIKGFFPSASKK